MDLTLGKFTITASSPALIVAEFSDGHEGDLEHAKKLVDAAQLAGADVVKFQMHFPDAEMVPGVTMWAGDLQDILKQVWFSPEKHAAMIDYCTSKGIQYLCTPFSPKAVDVLNELGVDGFKTGSGEVYNLPFHRKLAKISARTGKPVFISTGMCTMNELEETISIYMHEGAHFLIMNCTSEYPVRDYSHVRLGLIPVLQKKFGVHVGQSDHTDDGFTTYAAVTLGARVIEKHFTLDRNGSFPDDFMSLDPGMFRGVVDGVRKIESAMSSAEKNVTVEEEKIRSWAFASVVSNIDLKRGDSITTDVVRPARPGSGIPAKYLDELYSHELIGRRLAKDIPKNTVLKWEDVV